MLNYTYGLKIADIQGREEGKGGHCAFQFLYLATSIFFVHNFEGGEEGTKPGERDSSNH